MSAGRRIERRNGAAQNGSTALEFALVAIPFVILLFGIVQLGLVFFSLNFAGEVTRYVARTAVVCDKSATQQNTIKANRIGLLPMVFPDSATVSISYSDPAACIVTADARSGQTTTVSCATVTITPGVNVPNFIPFVPLDWNLPTLRTTLTPESFASAIDGSANPVCN